MNNARIAIAAALLTLPVMASAQSSQSTTQATASAAVDTNAQAYRDGVESATIDMAAKRKLDATKSFRYTHPPVKKGGDREGYLANFTAGYNAHLKEAGASSGQ